MRPDSHRRSARCLASTGRVIYDDFSRFVVAVGAIRTIKCGWRLPAPYACHTTPLTQRDPNMNDATRGLPLLYDAMRREMELTRPHDILPAVHRLMLALNGIGTCATASGCCSMHAAIAREALLRFETATSISVEDALSAEASRRSVAGLREAG